MDSHGSTFNEAFDQIKHQEDNAIYCNLTYLQSRES